MTGLGVQIERHRELQERRCVTGSSRETQGRKVLYIRRAKRLARVLYIGGDELVGLDLSNEELSNGDASIVIDGVPEGQEVDSGEEGVCEAEGKHGGDVSASVLCVVQRGIRSMVRRVCREACVAKIRRLCG